MLAANVIPLLPSPPLITRLLFEDPLILTAILIAAAVGAFVIFNSRGKVKKAMLWCGAGLALAAGVQVLAFAIPTDREAIIAATTPLPAAVAPWSIVAALTVGAGVGIAAGIYPASRAARLDPIAALRQE